MTETFGLKPEVIDKTHKVFGHHPEIHSVIIYGSRAKGTNREGSDIDLTLTGSISFSVLREIEDELDELLLPYSFDLSIYEDLGHEALLDHIRRVGKIFYERRTDSPAATIDDLST